MSTPKQTDPQFKLRMTPEIKEAIESAAANNKRSMNAEILARLEDSFTDKVGDHSPFLSQDEIQAVADQIVAKMKAGGVVIDPSDK